MATRFVVTDECDAHENFKLAFLNTKKEDIKLIVSPVGLPGRAIRNNFVKSIEIANQKVKKCYFCLKDVILLRLHTVLQMH